MLFLLRNIRRKLMQENKVTTYLLYAIGEILLVVVGILIAVSIDDWNERWKNRQLEVQYLSNIKLDLQKDLESLDQLVELREAKIASCRMLLAEFRAEGDAPLMPLAFSIRQLLYESHFAPNNTTFSELSSSGNLNIITSDTIKTLLFELQNLYKRNAGGIDHETYDYREYISKPMLRNVQLDVINEMQSGNHTAEELNLSKDDFRSLLADVSYRNGVFITEGMSIGFIELYEDISSASERIMDIIDRELQKY